MSVSLDPPTAVSRPPTNNLRPALLVIVGAASLVVALQYVLLRIDYPELAPLLILLSLAGLAYVFAGVLAWDRRPNNRMGLWLVVVGALTLVARLSLVPDAFLATVGLMLAQTPIAGVVVLMLLFPSGRFTGRLDRGLAVAAFVITVGFAIPTGLWRPVDGTAALRVGDPPALVAALGLIQPIAWWLLLALVVVILVGRLRHQRAVHGERRARVAVYVTGIVSVLLLPLVAQLGLLLGWSELAVFGVQVALLAVVPLVFTTSLLAGGFGRTGRLDELAARLGRTGQQSALRQVLADTLGDQSLQLLYRRRDGALVDENGRPATEPDPRPPTGSTEVALNGGATALIVYDTAAVPDPQLAAAAGSVVAVALDRDRLTAELLAEREELKRSRARIVEVGDLERRRLARDLHDGLQSRLVLAAIRAGGLAAVPDLPDSDRQSALALRLDLEESVQELRRLVHGVLPALLVERGLVPAARELVERCGIPSRTRFYAGEPALPPAVVTNAYFVLAEAITNAVKHAQASSIDVVVELQTDVEPAALRLEVRDDGRGTDGRDTDSRDTDSRDTDSRDTDTSTGVSRASGGLRGMADRVEALGGEFRFRSQPGAGSAVIAVIPWSRPGLLAA